MGVCLCVCVRVFLCMRVLWGRVCAQHRWGVPRRIARHGGRPRATPPTQPYAWPPGGLVPIRAFGSYTHAWPSMSRAWPPPPGPPPLELPDCGRARGVALDVLVGEHATHARGHALWLRAKRFALGHRAKLPGPSSPAGLAHPPACPPSHPTARPTTLAPLTIRTLPSGSSVASVITRGPGGGGGAGEAPCGALAASHLLLRAQPPCRQTAGARSVGAWANARTHARTHARSKRRA